jgi:hypothetical protein
MGYGTATIEGGTEPRYVTTFLLGSLKIHQDGYDHEKDYDCMLISTAKLRTKGS